MNRKRNISYIKPEDPPFLKEIKRKAGYDDRNHKFEVKQDDFVEDDESEQPQVVVLKEGDLTAEEAVIEKNIIESKEVKADLNQRVIFKTKKASDQLAKKHKKQDDLRINSNLLSFGDEDEDSR